VSGSFVDLAACSSKQESKTLSCGRYAAEEAVAEGLNVCRQSAGRPLGRGVLSNLCQ